MIKFGENGQLEKDIGDILDEITFCGCYEGDIRDEYPAARKEAIRRIVNLLKERGII